VIVSVRVAAFFAVIRMNAVPARGSGRIGTGHRIALIPSTTAVNLSVLVAMVTGVDPAGINRIAVLFG
jgi:hypothetical protein